MFNNEVLQLTQQALWMVLLIAGPPVVVASIVGIIVAFVQAATQLQEQSSQYAAKFFAIILTLFVTSTMLGGSIYHYSDNIFSHFPALIQP